MAGLILPVTLDGERITISQGYGADFSWKGYPNYYRDYYGLDGHNGIDFGGWGIDGVQVNAAGDGTVVYAGRGDYWDSTVGGGSFTVVIHHPHLGIWTAYLHLRNNSNTVTAGQTVKQGQMIARAGNTGIGTGAHLHFQVMPVAELPLVYQPNWGCINPKPYMTTITTASIAKDDDMPYLDWPKEDREALVKDLWNYRNPDKRISGGKDAYWWLLNPGHNVWRTRLKSVNGKMYQAAAFVINSNGNGWKIPALERLVKSVAGKVLTKTELDAAVEQINDNTDAAMADAVIDVDVKINGKELTP